MFFKTLLSLVTITCTTLCNNSNAAVDIEFYKNNECKILCNDEMRTFNGSKESLDEVNNLISDYFTIDSINYDNESSKLQLNLSHLEKNNPCFLIVKNTNKNVFPNISFYGGENKFHELLILGFKDVVLDALDAKSFVSYHTKKFVGSFTALENVGSRLTIKDGGQFTIKECGL